MDESWLQSTRYKSSRSSLDAGQQRADLQRFLAANMPSYFPTMDVESVDGVVADMKIHKEGIIVSNQKTPSNLQSNSVLKCAIEVCHPCIDKAKLHMKISGCDRKMKKMWRSAMQVRSNYGYLRWAKGS